MTSPRPGAYGTLSTGLVTQSPLRGVARPFVLLVSSVRRLDHSPAVRLALGAMAVTTDSRLRAAVRQWYPLALVFLTVGLSTAMAYPFMALFLTTAVRADPTRVTVYLVVAPLSAVIVAALLGRLSDRHPIRRRVLWGASLAGCISFALTAFIRDYPLLLGLTVTATATATAVLPQAFAYARTVLAGSDRAAMTMNTLRTLFSAAWVAGPPLATVLLDAGGFRAVYAMASAMYGLAALVVLLGLPEPVAGVDAAPTQARAPARPDSTPLVVWLTIAALVLMQSAANIGAQALSLFVPRDLGGSVRDAGLLLGLCAGLEIPLMLALGAVSTRIRLRYLVLAGPLLSTAYLALAAVATHTWQLAVGQLLNAASIAAIQGLGITYVQDLLPGQPGRTSTLYSNAFPAGAILAGPVLGAAAHFGYRSAYAAAGVLAAAGFGLLLGSRPAGPRPSPEAAQARVEAAQAPSPVGPVV